MINIFNCLEIEISKCFKIEEDKPAFVRLQKSIDQSIKILTYKKSFTSEKTGKIVATFVIDGLVIECICYFDRMMDSVKPLFAWSRLK